MISGEKSYTQAGNMRPPTKMQVLQWGKLAWDAITEAVIKNSFRVCRLTVKSDGSEDKEISGIKKNGVASDAKTIIEQNTARLVQGEQDDNNNDDADPFNSEDDEELEENEVVVEDDREDED